MPKKSKYSEIVWLPMGRIASTSTNADALTGLPNTYEKEGAKIVQEVLSPPQHASAHTLTPMVEITPIQPPQADAGDALTGITVFALLSAEAVRSAVKHWRALERT